MKKYTKGLELLFRLLWESIYRFCQISVHRKEVFPSSVDEPDLDDHIIVCKRYSDCKHFGAYSEGSYLLILILEVDRDIPEHLCVT